MKTDLIHILLADDDETDRLIFQDALREINLNTEVKTVNNGEQLMDYLATNSNRLPHLLFLDLNMPEKNGMECLKEIRYNDKLKDMVVAIYSTSATERDVEDTFWAGANVYIKKPAEFEELKKVLKKTIVSTSNYQSAPFNKANFLLRL